MSPELEIVKEWLTLAAEDLDAARELLALARPHLRAAAFFCQQGAEKALKAVLQFRDVRPPKTHALGELLDLATTVEPAFARFKFISWVTHFAVNVRYPGLEPGPKRERVETALDQAEQVFRFVLSHIPPEAHP